MESIEYWFVKCKICSQFHRGSAVDRIGTILNVPFDSVDSCPSVLGKSVAYHTRDWFPMTLAQWRQLEEQGSTLFESA
jgi:hypothetical protein